MKTKHAFILITAIVSGSLAGCSSVSTLMGGKSSPDEFAVYSRAPLSIPPEYKLRPPSPGATRPQEVEPRDSAEKVVWGSGRPGSSRNAPAQSAKTAGGGAKTAVAHLTPGEKSLVRLTGGDKTDPEIRAIVNREAVVPVAGSKTIADKVLFWRDPRKQISIVDPEKENKRIRKQQAQGKPITSDGVPTIDQDIDRSFFDILLFD